MNYSEASYFDGFHFAHIAAKEESDRLKRIAKRTRSLERERSRGGRMRDFHK